jgi:hypothetical protein
MPGPILESLWGSQIRALPGQLLAHGGVEPPTPRSAARLVHRSLGEMMRVLIGTPGCGINYGRLPGSSAAADVGEASR